MTNIELDVARSQIRANKAVADHYEQYGNVDWEQRRYEIAKECMNTLLKRSENHAYPTELVIANRSVRYADALIDELKKNNNK